MSCKSPRHNGKQGRECDCATNASRAALGLSPLSMRRVPGLHTEEGGHSVNGGVSFPMELDDKPLSDPYDVGCWLILGFFAVVIPLSVLALLAIVYQNSPR
jgi:hypothetical protein